MIKSTFREIKTSITRWLAIFAIVALGVGFFSGLKDCKASMVSTVDRYLSEHNFYDYRLLSSYGIDAVSVKLASAVEGVESVEPSIQLDVITELGTGDEKTELILKAISLPHEINTLRLVEGRLPEKADECVIDNYTFTADGFSIGGKLKLAAANDEDRLGDFKEKEFTIVGKVNTPIYMDYQRGTTDLGDGSISTFFFIPMEAFATEYYTDLYVKLTGDEEILSDELTAKLDRNEAAMEKLAESITADRRSREQGEARKELAEKQKEYDDAVKEYEEKKADAEREISDAQKKIDDGWATVRSEEKKLNSTINNLNDKKDKVEDGLKEAKAGKKKLEDGLKGSDAEKKKANEGIKQLETAKSTAEEEYNQGKIQIETAIAGLNQQLQDPTLSDEEVVSINAQITALSKQLSEAKAGRDAAIKEIDAQIKKAKDGLAEISAAEKQLKEVNTTIASLEKNLSDIDTGLRKASNGKSTIGKEKGKLNEAESDLKNARADADKEFADAEKELSDAERKIKDAEKKIGEMETGNSYALTRGDNAGYSSFDSNSNIVNNIAKIFPVFFFMIAALVCMTTMTRMIDEQRTQIGVLKALGYSNGAILAKYMFYSGSAAFLGAVVGFFVGCKIFPMVIWRAYTMMYDFSPDVDYIIDWKLFAISLAVAMICSVGATWASVSADFKVAPSDLIRPKAPKAGKRIFLERIKPIWNHLGFLRKVSMRNIFRDKKRFLMMVIGVSGCTALLIAGMGINTTISGVADHQFDEISLYDYQVIFNKDMTEKDQTKFLEYMKDELGEDAGSVKFLHQSSAELLRDKESSIESTIIAADFEGFGEYVDIHYNGAPVEYPKDGEAIIVSKLQREADIKVGDEIKLKDGYREMTVRVSGICEYYVGDNIFMNYQTYRSGFGTAAEIKSAYVTMPADSSEDLIREVSTAAAKYDDTAAIVLNIDTRERVNKMMKSLDSVVYVVILSAGLLAFIVLYNLTNINITERTREIATIKVLGFFPIEVSQYVFRENLILTAAAALVGIPLGMWLLDFVISNIVVKFIYFEARLDRMDYAVAIILTFVFAFIVNLAMQFRLRAISMTESLKSVE